MTDHKWLTALGPVIEDRARELNSMSDRPLIYDCKLDEQRQVTQRDVAELHAIAEVGHLLAEIRLYCFEPRGRRLFKVRDKLRVLLDELGG